MRSRVTTRAQERIIRREIKSGATRAEAAAAAGITERSLYRALHIELSDLPPGRHGHRPDREYPPPTAFVDIDQDEIARRAAAIRATWSEEREREAWNPRFCESDGL
jgi:hypothetical protein